MSGTSRFVVLRKYPTRQSHRIRRRDREPLKVVFDQCFKRLQDPPLLPVPLGQSIFHKFSKTFRK